MPRGGIPVAHEVAKLLQAPLDVFVVRKLGVPTHEELAMGAVASGGIRHLNNDVIDELRIPQSMIDEVAAREQARVDELDSKYRKDRPSLDLKGKIAILVDDGLATGSTMIAAVKAARTQQPSSIVVAVPVAAPQVADMLRSLADAVLVVRTPAHFWAVGAWYERFDQVGDEQVLSMLAEPG